MDKLIIQKYPKFNDEFTFDDVIELENLFEEGTTADCNYSKEIIDFYKPYYTNYKTEKYWYNPCDNKLDCYSNEETLRENLFVDFVPEGVISWIESHSDGDMDTHCILTKEVLQELCRLCWCIGNEKYVAEATFPSSIDSYDFIYFRTIFKLMVVLPHIISETDFEKYEVICNLI